MVVFRLRAVELEQATPARCDQAGVARVKHDGTLDYSETWKRIGRSNWRPGAGLMNRSGSMSTTARA